MNVMNIPYGKPYKDMSEIDNEYVDPYMDMSEKKSLPCPKMVLAIAYVLDQSWETPYEISKGLERGTIFQGLDKPFLGGGSQL